MTRVLVAYGAAIHDPSGAATELQSRQLHAWATDHNCELLVWRREGRSALTRPIEFRTRLHQALFCIRADFADDLWIHEWPREWGPWDEALIGAVVGSHGGRLLVEGSVRRLDPSDPNVRHAGEWMKLLNELDPRKVTREGPEDLADIGAYLGTEEATRLAFKLRDDFGLTESKIAVWLEKYDYESPSGTPYTAGGVHHLLNGSVVSALDVERASIHDAREKSRSPLPKVVVATFGPEAEGLVARAEEWNLRQADPAGLVVAVTDGGLISDPATAMSSREDLKRLLSILPVVAAVHLSSEEALATDPADRMFLVALLEYHGIQVVVDGDLLPSTRQRDAEAAEYRQAKSALLLHQQLRAHDKGTVQDPDLSLEAAFARAMKKRDQDFNRTLDRIARELNEEGIPTRRGTGQWWAASVKALLERGPR